MIAILGGIEPSLDAFPLQGVVNAARPGRAEVAKLGEPIAVVRRGVELRVSRGVEHAALGHNVIGFFKVTNGLGLPLHAGATRPNAPGSVARFAGRSHRGTAQRMNGDKQATSGETTTRHRVAFLDGTMQTELDSIKGLISCRMGAPWRVRP